RFFGNKSGIIFNRVVRISEGKKHEPKRKCNGQVNGRPDTGFFQRGRMSFFNVSVVIKNNEPDDNDTRDTPGYPGDLHIRESFLALANLNTTSLSPDVEYGTRIRPNNDVRRADVCGAYGILPCTDMTISANLQQYCDVPDCHAR